MRRREQKLWLGTFTDTTPNSTQMGMTSMWRWSPLLQHVQLGLISGAEAAAQPNLIPAPGPGPCAGDCSLRVFESPPCIHPVLYCPWVPGVVGEGRDGWGMSAKDKPAAAWRRLLPCANHWKPLNCSIISFVHSIIQNCGVCWSWLKFTLKQEILFQTTAQIYLASR